MGNLKGQVAIEYLTTYGWAILLLIIVIGALASIFSSMTVSSEECSIDKNNLPCRSQVYTSGKDLIVETKMYNGLGYPIKIIEFKIINDEIIADQMNYPNSRISSGDEINIIGTFADTNKRAGESIDLDVEIKYVSCAPEINPECNTGSSNPERIKTGKITAKILQG
ncbi:MAG: hypothetical protein WC501_04090 [Candidatus Micrarchaeia archaeon]